MGSPPLTQLTRRALVRRLGTGALMAATLPLLKPSRAAAGIVWCRSDPIVRLNGTRVQFWVSILEEDLPYVNGPITCRVQTAQAVVQELIFLDAGFNGYGETVTFTTMVNQVALPGQPFPVNVWVDVPNSKRKAKFPIVLDVVPENGAAVSVTGNAGATNLSLTVTPLG